MTDIFSKSGISLERLQTLRDVVRTGSITRAARDDATRQSLISRQRKSLTKAVGFDSAPHALWCLKGMADLGSFWRDASEIKE